MTHRTTPAKLESLSGPNAARSTLGASEAFAKRHVEFGPDFFRPTTFGTIVSSLGIGTYLGESTDADDEAYERSVAHAIRSGMNLIDTAINYRSQRSERSIGAALQEVLAGGTVTRQELTICSKAGYIPFELTPPATREAYRDYVRRCFLEPQILNVDEIVAGGHSLAPRFLKYCLAKSRQNLGVRTIDVYYLHNPGQQLSGEARSEFTSRVRLAFVSLEESVARGEIGVYGCATWDEFRVPPEAAGHVALETLVSIARDVAGNDHHFRAVQMPINFAMTEALRVTTQPLGGHLVSALVAAEELGLTVFASAPLLQSKLTSGLPAELADEFPGCTTDAQRALSFVRALPGVTAALVGTKTEQHVDENLAIAHQR
jgi:aryl-alcohol dehydrogenase-like predicted oxidoreductase